MQGVVKDKELCFLPTGCSIQCVMEDQSGLLGDYFKLWLKHTQINVFYEFCTSKISLFLRDKIRVVLAAATDEICVIIPF